MKVNLRQAIVISLILTAFHLVPALHEWAQLGFPRDKVLLISVPIWLTFFNVGPFWVYYGLTQHSWFANQGKWLRCLGYILLMILGAHVVSRVMPLAFPHWQLDVFNQVFSGVLWGIFQFTLWEFYCIQQRLEQEKFLRKQVELNNLSNQLNPHFLFNGLNTISSLMLSEVEKADSVLHKFADLLRYALDKKDGLIDLQSEVEICQFYLDIEQERFGDNLKVDWQINTDMQGHQIPPLILQPLLENALKHAGARPLEITIVISSDAKSLYIEILDNGKGFPEDVLNGAQYGTGLKLVKERLALLDLGTLTLKNIHGALKNTQGNSDNTLGALQQLSIQNNHKKMS